VLTRKYEDRQRKPDDLEAQEGQRPIAVHALENLGTSDTGITMLRHLLREQIKRVEDGLDPMNVMRDARANQKIPPNAWNTILLPLDVLVLQGKRCNGDNSKGMGGGSGIFKSAGVDPEIVDRSDGAGIHFTLGAIWQGGTSWCTELYDQTQHAPVKRRPRGISFYCVLG